MAKVEGSPNKFVVKGGTVMKLIERLFSLNIDAEFNNVFLLTYRSFTDGATVLRETIRKFNEVKETPEEAEEHTLITEQARLQKSKTRQRVGVVLKDWVTKHFYDFEQDKSLLADLKKFIEENPDDVMLHGRILTIINQAENPNTRHTVVFSKPPDPTIPIMRSDRGGGFQFTDIDPLELARQLTIYEFDLLCKIKSCELLSCGWAKKDKETRSPNLLRMVQHFNDVTAYVSTLICSELNLTKRVELVRRVLSVIERAQNNLQNFFAVFELTAGLNCSAVSRLKLTWDELAKDRSISPDKIMALTSPLLKERRINRGDEVITVAAGFPTTVAPIIQYGAIPVFVDVTIPQYNIDVTMLEEALSNKTKAVMVAHTLGNPFDLKVVKEFCDKHNLWLVEDNCDALGSKYEIDGEERFTGTIGDIGTSSFYPPHHMTMGEGGAVYTNNPLLHKIIRSFRDWGRDCVCPPGKDNICGHRFDKQYGELPLGYDHKYVYSHFGYNLKVTDMQAAVGVAQLKKFPSFIERRRHNFNKLYEGLSCLQDKLILPQPCPNSKPSWFGFLITCKQRVDRNKLVTYIERKGIQKRTLFTGNLIKHPCFDEMRKNEYGYRVIGNLKNTDRIMNDTFWIGVYPGMTDEKIDYMIKTIKDFF